MHLLTPELLAELPKLYPQDGNSNPTVYAKFFFPAGCWTWFVTEGEPNGDDFTFFGFVRTSGREDVKLPHKIIFR